MLPNRVCGATDKADRDRNSPSTECCSICGSEIDIIQRDNSEVISYKSQTSRSYCTWVLDQICIVHGLWWGEKRGKEKEQSNVSAK